MKVAARLGSCFFPFLLLIAGIAVLSEPAAAQISVTLANPNNAAPGTVNLNVVVNGSGFKKGARAQWFVTGTTNPGGVTVNSTAFSSSSTLIANITVATDAVVGSFDVQVMNADGRTGKGTELFAVKQSACNANLTIQPLILTGTCSTSGCVDASFGTGGQTAVNVNPTDVHANHAAYPMGESDGKVVAVGPAGAWGVARFNPNGSLDTTFHGTGYAVYLAADSPYPAVPYAAALQPDNRIVITGNDTNMVFTVGRINADGTPDNSFGGTGFVTLNLGTTKKMTSAGKAVAIQADGKIIVSDGVAGGWTILRFLPSGVLDGSFGSGGKVTIAALAGTATAVSFQNVAGEQRILLAGDASTTSTGSDFAVARLRSSGQLDTTFGSGGNGASLVNFCGNEGISSLAFDLSGNILTSGALPNDSYGASNLGLVRFTPNGLLDSTFGNSGSLSIAVPYGGSNATFGKLTVDSVGRIIISGGYASPTAGMSYLMMARLNPDGTPDPNFSGGAVVHSDLGLGTVAVTLSNGEYFLGAAPNTGATGGIFSVMGFLP
jgi:uncharacterized delta-60 repeat protein